MAVTVSPVLLNGLARCRPYLTAAAVFSLFINLLTIALPLYTIQIFNRVMVSGSGATLIVITLAVCAALLASAILEHVRTRLFIAIGVRFDARLSTQLMERQVEASVKTGGMLSSQALRDLDTVRGALTGGAALAILDLPWTPVFIAICWFLHPVLGLLAAFGAITLLGLAAFNQWYVSRPMAESGDKGEAAYRMTDTILRNAEIVQAMGMLPDLMRRWSRYRTGLMQQQAVASSRNAKVSGLIKLLRYGLQIAVFAIGAWLVVERSLSAGALFAASILVTRALMPIDQMVGAWRQLVAGLVALKRVETALADEARPQAMRLPTPRGDLAVERLTYMPPGAKSPILLDVSFQIEAGDALGIVGPSAAGKSTLARLIVGALKPSNGLVRLDGADTWSWDRAHFGEVVGYVPQDIELFDGTVKENIARFRDCPPEDIVRASQMAGVHDMILRLPMGYDTPIGNAGYTLSGGQRQRIALARAVIGKPRMVIFDEANSNLDGEGEATLRHLVARLKADGVTVIMIAHRPSVLVTLDKVLVLSNGTVTGFGTVGNILPLIAPGFQPTIQEGQMA